jgi:hypothetical protein
MKKTAVITGDIVNSTKQKNTRWQVQLKRVLREYGKENIDWEIKRGDSFQLRVQPKTALSASLHIKAAIKQLSKNIDVRMSIGVGKEPYANKKKKISLCTGEPYILSGRGFDNLKKKYISFHSSHDEINLIINAMLSLAMLTMNKWTPIQAKTYLWRKKHESLTITLLARKMKKSASTISETLKKCGYSEIQNMDKAYQKLILKL